MLQRDFIFMTIAITHRFDKLELLQIILLATTAKNKTVAKEKIIKIYEKETQILATKKMFEKSFNPQSTLWKHI